MIILAVKVHLDSELKQCTLVFITDRTKLEEQLSNAFRDRQGKIVHNADSVVQLKELHLVIATVQKFADLDKE